MLPYEDIAVFAVLLSKAGESTTKALEKDFPYSSRPAKALADMKNRCIALLRNTGRSGIEHVYSQVTP